MQNDLLDSIPPQRELAVIERDIEIRALSNPERIRILNHLVERPGTAKQIAAWVGATRGRTHYHVKELEKAQLVEIVSKVERGGVVEKYYRAVARNFCMTRSIGENADLTRDLKEMIASSMLGWRRENILDVDEAAIARRIIRDCLSTRRGDVVLIKGDFVHQDIIQALHRAVGSVGAQCVVLYRNEGSADFLVRWKDDLSSAIVLEEPVDHLTADISLPARDLPPDRRNEILSRIAAKGTEFRHAGVPGDPLEDEVSRRLIDAGVRSIYFGYPSPQRAEMMGVDFRVLHDACWTALDVDYQELERDCAAARSILESGSNVHIRSRGGTDLRFDIEGSEVFVDDGIISQWEVDNRRCWGHLPAGKVIVAPRKGSANGTLYSRITDYLGIPIAGIRLTFRDGEVVSATADENEDLLLEILAAGDGDARMLGGFEIGMNPKIGNPIGYAVWDSKSYGDITLAIGENRAIKGENESDFAWGLRVVEPQVVIDGQVILEKRRFLS